MENSSQSVSNFGRLRNSEIGGCAYPQNGCGGRGIMVSDRGSPCHELKPSTTKDPPCRGAMQFEFVESSNVLTLVWYLGEEGASSGVIHVT
ncbi:hypothetical protein TNCV_2761931 [Trichonephila clavipes]|nr:hypothetical protein TNCV_2761931 [Trichonephila clavipes]